VPAALEAVCLKAMALRPEDRYATVLELAADVEHWLADEPLAAHREPLPARLGRWTRRHRSLVTGIGAAGGVAALGLAMATMLLTAAYRETEQQRDQARTQRDKAKARFELAHDAVDKFHTEASESPELRAHGLELLRQKLLESAVEFYRKFAQEEPEDLALQAERGRTYWRLANLYRALGRNVQAEKTYQEAMKIQKQVVSTQPEAPQYQADLAETYHRLGLLHEAVGRKDAAEQAYKAALAIHKELAASHPQEPEYRHQLAYVLNNLAVLYGTSHRLQEAEVALGDAKELREDLASAYVSVAKYQAGLGGLWTNLGKLYTETNRPSQSEAAYKRALEIHQKLANEQPSTTAFQSDMAIDYNNLGHLYYATGRLDEAELPLSKGLAIWERLHREHPTVIEFAHGLGVAYLNLGLLARANDRFQTSIDWFTQALQSLEAVVMQESQNAGARQFMRDAFWGRGEALNRLGRHAEALPDWERAIGLSTGRKLIPLRLGRALTLARLGDHARATAAAEEMAQRNSLTAEDTYNLACVFSLAAVPQLGNFEPRAEPEGQAERHAARAVALLRKAKAAGYFKEPANIEQLKKDSDLNPLRLREDFRKLLEALEDKPLATTSRAEK
jgi:tetratricopeptide (TPR) repeat protein